MASNTGSGKRCNDQEYRQFIFRRVEQQHDLENKAIGTLKSLHLMCRHSVVVSSLIPIHSKSTLLEIGLKANFLEDPQLTTAVVRCQ